MIGVLTLDFLIIYNLLKQINYVLNSSELVNVAVLQS